MNQWDELQSWKGCCDDVETENRRLNGIIIDMQAEMARLERDNDRLTEERREIGERNAKLNKENGKQAHRIRDLQAELESWV